MKTALLLHLGQTADRFFPLGYQVQEHAKHSFSGRRGPLGIAGRRKAGAFGILGACTPSALEMSFGTKGIGSYGPSTESRTPTVSNTLFHVPMRRPPDGATSCTTCLASHGT